MAMEKMEMQMEMQMQMEVENWNAAQNQCMRAGSFYTSRIDHALEMRSRGTVLKQFDFLMTHVAFQLHSSST